MTLPAAGRARSCPTEARCLWTEKRVCCAGDLYCSFSSVLAPFLARSSMEAMLQENVTWPVSWTLLCASRSFVLPPSPHLPSGAITPDPDAAWECRLDAVGTQLPSFCRQTLSQGLPFTAASCPLPSRGTWR